MLASVERLKRDVDQYRHDLKDQIIRDEAGACLDFESQLQTGLFIYRELNRLDEALRLRAFRGELEYSADLERAFHDLFQWWSEPCDHALEYLRYFEDQGFVVANADEFRASCSEVRGMLADDAEFFSGDELADLRDEAVEAFRRDQCEDMRR